MKVISVMSDAEMLNGKKHHHKIEDISVKKEIKQDAKQLVAKTPEQKQEARVQKKQKKFDPALVTDLSKATGPPADLMAEPSALAAQPQPAATNTTQQAQVAPPETP